MTIRYADGVDSVEEKRRYFQSVVCNGVASCEDTERSDKSAVLSVWAVAPGVSETFSGSPEIRTGYDNVKL